MKVLNRNEDKLEDKRRDPLQAYENKIRNRGHWMKKWSSFHQGINFFSLALLPS